MTRVSVPCQEMTQIRADIDALDQKLVALLADRQRLIEAAGKVKPQRHQVRDTARIEEVVALVLQAADAHGLSRDIAEPLWRLLIERSIGLEYDVFAKR